MVTLHLICVDFFVHTHLSTLSKYLSYKRKVGNLATNAELTQRVTKFQQIKGKYVEISLGEKELMKTVCNFTGIVS